MARILLIQAPLSREELYAQGASHTVCILPPLGLAYIAAFLQQHGHECRIIEGAAEPVGMDEICRVASEYDMVGVTVLSPYAKRAMELVRALRDSGLELPVVVGGAHVTVLPESMLECGADYAVVGEGELTILELVNCLFGGREGVGIENISGLVFRAGDGYVHNSLRSPIDPLDQVPLPARELLPMHRYRGGLSRAKYQPSHSMMASRGCSGACSYCPKKILGGKVRYFSVERIVEEFFLLRDKYGARDVSVMDDNFISSPEVALSVSDNLRSRNFGLTWMVSARIDCVTREVLKGIKDAGCSFICFGIESGSQRILNHINKRTTKEQIRETVRIAGEVGIPVQGFYMVGMPTETAEEMKETIDFALELDTDVATFTLYVPLPGTVEYKRACKSGAFDPEYYKRRIIPEFTFLDFPVYVPEGMTAKELMSIHRTAYRRYYLRPKMILRKILSIRSPSILFQGAMTLLKMFFWKGGGICLKVVRKQLRHKSIETTRKYAHLSPDFMRSELSILDRRLSTETNTETVAEFPLYNNPENSHNNGQSAGVAQW